MTIRTMTVGSETGADFSTGWKELLIKKATYGDYNGKKYLDISFENYPDHMKTRVWEAINPKTKEEFRISSWFRFTQAGIQEVLNDGGNKPIITYDDDASLLVGMPINVYIHEEYSTKDDRNYARIWHQPAPVAGEGEHLTFTEKDVSFWKISAQNGLKKWNERNGVIPNQNSEGNSTQVPF